MTLDAGFGPVEIQEGFSCICISKMNDSYVPRFLIELWTDILPPWVKIRRPTCRPVGFGRGCCCDVAELTFSVAGKQDIRRWTGHSFPHCSSVQRRAFFNSLNSTLFISNTSSHRPEAQYRSSCKRRQRKAISTAPRLSWRTTTLNFGRPWRDWVDDVRTNCWSRAAKSTCKKLRSYIKRIKQHKHTNQ